MSAPEKLLLPEIFSRKDGNSDFSIKYSKDGLYLPEADGLSGLLTHSAFQNSLTQLFLQSKTANEILACLIIDIDYFHAINRRYGYTFGDAVIRQIANILRQTTNEEVLISRFSGEQFTLAWLTQARQSAVQFAERIRVNIANHNFKALDKSTYLTVSLGLAVSDGKTKSAAELLSCSQLVLRTAKREGRNRVCYWEREALTLESNLQNDLVAELQRKFADLEREVKAFGTSEVRSLIDRLEIPDGLPEDHAENVAFIAASIADEIGLPEKEIDTIISAALLHDIGKLGIDKDILSKNGSLTSEEFEEIKKHPLLGAEFLQQSEFFEKELPLILHHHERYDGKGYPDGLKGENIPLGARIIGLAESIDGLLSGSTYRKSLSIREAINEIRRCAGSQFDPGLVQIAIKLLESGCIG